LVFFLVNGIPLLPLFLPRFFLPPNEVFGQDQDPSKGVSLCRFSHPPTSQSSRVSAFLCFFPTPFFIPYSFFFCEFHKLLFFFFFANGQPQNQLFSPCSPWLGACLPFSLKVFELPFLANVFLFVFQPVLPCFP